MTVSKKKYHWKKKKESANGGVVTEYHSICAYCAREVVYNHGYRPQHCPHCGSSNYRKPPTEVELFHLQAKYIETKDKSILTDMYDIILAYSKSIVKKSLPAEFTYHYSLVDEKSSDVAHLLIESYLSKPSFQIEQSFAGYLQNKTKEVLWNKISQKEDSIGSLDVSDYGGNSEETLDLSEIMDVYAAFQQEGQSATPEASRYENNDVVDGVINILSRVFNESKKAHSVQFALLLLWGIYLKIARASQDKVNMFYKKFGSESFEVMEKTLIVIFDFLRDREE